MSCISGSPDPPGLPYWLQRIVPLDLRVLTFFDWIFYHVQLWTGLVKYQMEELCWLGFVLAKTVRVINNGASVFEALAVSGVVAIFPFLFCRFSKLRALQPKVDEAQLPLPVSAAFVRACVFLRIVLLVVLAPFFAAYSRSWVAGVQILALVTVIYMHSTTIYPRYAPNKRREQDRWRPACDVR